MPETGLTHKQLMSLAEQHGHLGFWRVDINADQLFWSDRVYEIHGLPPQSEKPRVEDAINFYHPDDRAMVEKAVNDAAQSGEPFEYYGARIVQPDGQTRFVFARGEVRKNSNGEPTDIYGVFRDVTDEKRDADALKNSEERFRLAALGASVGIWDWTSIDGDELYWSDQFYTLIGYKRNEIKADIPGFQDLLHPADVEPTFHALLRHMERKTPYRLEYRLRHKTKGYRWFLVTGQAGWNEDGQAVRMVGSVQDIHEQKTAQTNLAEANRELSQFASIASHDLQERSARFPVFPSFLKKSSVRACRRRLRFIWAFLKMPRNVCNARSLTF
ncbi:PAS domain-containing protein [Hyphobacterium sp.]|uniref:PAS domain-containing protein n=1 Tax=Hyphobacterium sp. TaxID=2004662 RepID=UPI003BAD48EB